MNGEFNILLGQRLLPDGKIRLHWQVDKDFYPAKPLGSVNIDNTLQLIPVEERWLEGDKANFEGFTIPYYDYIYMKDMGVENEAYIVQPYEHDIIVIDVELDVDVLKDAFSVNESSGGESVVLINGNKEQSVVQDFAVIAGLNRETGKPYTQEEVISMDMAIGFKDIWKEDLGKIAEAFTYATLVNSNSLKNAQEQGNTQKWG